jgi:hypothetical protein
LFAGVDVIKTPTANLLNAGTTGTINLRTRRPLDLGSGLTTSLAVEAAYGDGKGEVEPQANGLLGWRGENTGVLLSVAYSDVTQANYYNGLQGNSGWTGLPGESTNWPNDTAGDVNGDGDTSDQFIAFQGHTAFNKFTERERPASTLHFKPKSLTTYASPRMRFSRTRRTDRTAGFAAPKTSGSVGNGSRPRRARPPAR